MKLLLAILAAAIVLRWLRRPDTTDLMHRLHRSHWPVRAEWHRKSYPGRDCCCLRCDDEIDYGIRDPHLETLFTRLVSDEVYDSLREQIVYRDPMREQRRSHKWHIHGLASEGDE